MKQDHSWLCQPGDWVDGESFSPPIPPVGGPILEVTAFHATKRDGQRFVRADLGTPWVHYPPQPVFDGTIAVGVMTDYVPSTTPLTATIDLSAFNT